MIELVAAPRETARFGVRVARASIGTLDPLELIAALERDPFDVAILRLPSASLDAVEGLRRHGLTPIVADTLVRYEVDLGARQRSTNRDDIVLRDAKPAGAPLLASLAREIFTGYVSHYHANPLFAPGKILDGYAEWAASHVDPNDIASAAWIVERGNAVVGLSCYRLDTEERVAFGVLNGIVPAARGRGNYRAMLARMLDHFAALGMRRFSIATQIQNSAVQRTWTKEGLALTEVSNTVHINMPVTRQAVTTAGARRLDASR